MAFKSKKNNPFTALGKPKKKQSSVFARGKARKEYDSGKIQKSKPMNNKAAEKAEEKKEHDC